MTAAVIFGAMLMLAGLSLFALYSVVRSADKPDKAEIVERHILGHWR